MKATVSHLFSLSPSYPPTPFLAPLHAVTLRRNQYGLTAKTIKLMSVKVL